MHQETFNPSSSFDSEPEKLLYVSTDPEDSRVSVESQSSLDTPYTGQSWCREAFHHVLHGFAFSESSQSERNLHPLGLPGFADFTLEPNSSDHRIPKPFLMVLG